MFVSVYIYCKKRANTGIICQNLSELVCLTPITHHEMHIPHYCSRRLGGVVQKESRLRIAGGAASEGWEPCFSE